MRLSRGPYEQGSRRGSHSGEVPMHDSLPSDAGGAGRRFVIVWPLDDIGTADGEVHDRCEDRGEEDRAGNAIAETETTVCRRRREPVAEVCAEWARQNVCEPEGQHR